MSFSQFYELWSGGGCQRRCDGAHLIPSDEPCQCDPDERECKPHTRVSVMLADFPTSGLWRLDTQGYYAAVELSGGFEMATLIAKASGRTMLTGTLRLEQREVKRPGQQTRKFAVPVIDFDIDVRAFVGDTASLTSAPPPAQIERTVTPVPRDESPAPSVAEQLQAVETPAAPKRRANAAEPLPPTGLAPRTVGGASQPSMRRLFAILGGKGIKDDDERHKWASGVLGKTVTTFAELSQGDVIKLNDAVEGKTDIIPVDYQDGEEPF